MENPFTTQHNLSVNGGSERINYFMSAGYYSQSGTFNNLDFTRYSFRSNVDAKVADNFTIGLDVDGNMSDQRTPYWPHDSDKDLMNDMYRALLNFPTTEPAYYKRKAERNHLQLEYSGSNQQRACFQKT